ncbi:RNA polymerase Rpc34 [Polyplosphaeria fusca]|uniref:DNA-directed RNA polymerase III subunit RPC6 n=1 Tax=Polyplosphaeria fusca TaxID=682080 RepID=A0A9P4QLY3_9PLEO|nr:RNA polymerase Rpc34 [Polyplosphaeria fusca]
MASASSHDVDEDAKPDVSLNDGHALDAPSNAAPAAPQPAAKSKLDAPARRAKAEELYQKCLEYPPDTLFFQRDLSNMEVAADMSELAHLLQELVDRLLLKLMILDNDPCWKYRSREDAQVLRSLTSDERLLYHHIDQEQNKGVWSKTLRSKTTLTLPQVNKALKALEARKLVKAILSVKHPSRKMYLLMDVVPSDDFGGGGWQNDSGELDHGLVNQVSEVIMTWMKADTCVEVAADGSDYTGNRAAAIARKKAHVQQTQDIEDFPTRPAFTPPFRPTGKMLIPRELASYPTATSLAKRVNDTGFINNKTLTAEDMNQLLEIMVCDGRLEKVSGNYRASLAALSTDYSGGFIDAPCGNCPVFDQCVEDGQVSARICVYFREWLQTESARAYD